MELDFRMPVLLSVIRISESPFPPMLPPFVCPRLRNYLCPQENSPAWLRRSITRKRQSRGRLLHIRSQIFLGAQSIGYLRIDIGEQPFESMKSKRTAKRLRLKRRTAELKVTATSHNITCMCCLEISAKFLDIMVRTDGVPAAAVPTAIPSAISRLVYRCPKLGFRLRHRPQGG